MHFKPTSPFKPNMLSAGGAYVHLKLLGYEALSYAFRTEPL
jgi:hypothetical protein